MLPIAKFLFATHMKQAIRNDDLRTIADRRFVFGLLMCHLNAPKINPSCSGCSVSFD